MRWIITERLVTVPASRATSTASGASLRRAAVLVGTMFELQRSISLEESHTSNGKRFASEAAARVGNVNVGSDEPTITWGRRGFKAFGPSRR